MASLAADPTTPLRASDHDGAVLWIMSDADADGVPDDVDDCVATEPPVVTSQQTMPGVLSGTATDCSGIQSIELEAGSVGLVLTTTGSAGDTEWTFHVELEPAAETGSGTLAVTDTDGNRSTLDIQLTRANPIPALDPRGIVSLVVLLALGGLAILRRTA